MNKEQTFKQWQELCHDINGKQFEDIKQQYNDQTIHEDETYIQVEDIDGQLTVYIDRQEDGTARVSGDNIHVLNDEGTDVLFFNFETSL